MSEQVWRSWMSAITRAGTACGRLLEQVTHIPSVGTSRLHLDRLMNGGAPRTAHYAPCTVSASDAQ